MKVIDKVINKKRLRNHITHDIVYVLSDFVAIICAAFQKMIDSSSVFKGFVLGFATDAKDGYILHSFCKLNHRLTLN